uniref:CRAL/TRIO N-terminal domain-containing protein n=2 Tax=Brassica TaxID=3705 RepID=M4ELG7_BRACM
MRISMAARKYICLVSRMSGDEIVHIAIPFIRENILEIGSWRHREAAISAYESILDGSTINKLSPHVTGLLRFLLPTIKDENNVPETMEGFQKHQRVTGSDNTVSASQQPKVIEKLTVSKKKSLIELMPLVRGNLNSNGELEKEMWKIFLLEEEKSQVILMKFLSAKDFSVKKSLKMLKNTLKWRTTMRIKELCQGQSVVDHPTSIFIYGHDREGHAVVYDNVYNDFPKKIFDDRTELDCTVSSFLKT